MKQKLKILCLIPFLSIIFILALSLSACSNNVADEPEYKSVITCVQSLKNSMNYPESFAVNGVCGYGKDTADATVIVIPFKSSNAFGVYKADIAYFLDGVCYGYESDYTSGDYNSWSPVYRLLFGRARNVRVNNKYLKTYDAETVMKGL